MLAINPVSDIGYVAPVNTVAPAITGTTTEGSALTCSNGTWTGTATITFTRAWRKNGVPNGSTGAQYTVAHGDIGATIDCVVTADNGAVGTVDATSNGVVGTTANPVNTVAPVISGSAPSGSTLTSTTGTWTGSATIVFSYQWKRGVTNVGTNSNTYVTQVADEGSAMTCVVTGTNAGTPASATSNSISVTTPFAAAEWASAGGGTLSNSNKTVTFSADLTPTRSGSAKASGAGIFYIEGTYSGLTDQAYIGLIKDDVAMSNNTLGEFGNEVCLFNGAGTGSVYRNGSFVAGGASVPTFVSGDVVGMVLDFNTGFVTWVVNGDTAGAYTRSFGSTAGSSVVAVSPNTGAGAGGAFVMNFGDSAFAYPAMPAFYSATAGLPA